MIQSEFSAALHQICAEKGITPEVVLESLKAALVAAYRRETGGEVEGLEAIVNPETGQVQILKDGRNETPPGFGRIASQTAKQVILQKLREAEKSAIRSEFEGRVGSLVSVVVQRLERGNVIVDLGKTYGLLPPGEQLQADNYRPGGRFRVVILRVAESSRGPEVVVSRTSPILVTKLFETEVPEIRSGSVEIKGVAREAGQRSKVAVASRQTGVDPVGSCVGQKGVRVQAVISELGEEKIDIVPYSEETDKFIAGSLSPAKVLDVTILSKKKKEVRVKVLSDQLSLAIGRDGQNVRLASKLTGWKIDIKGSGKKAPETAPDLLSATTLSKRILNRLTSLGITRLSQLREKPLSERKTIKGLGEKSSKEIEALLK